MANILEVKNLKISFRTASGNVKAVRDISFNLEKGKTLAIVGESGSGKSVTSKAILGILAGNSIVEGGEILYDGKDLLKISEEDMCEIRGDEISMIFQDPLSSLNPIVKIGKQITEAMLLKNKTSRNEAKKQFNNTLALLQKHMLAADPANEAKVKEMTSTFDKFCIEANRLENSYNRSMTTGESMVPSVEDFLFRAGKDDKLKIKEELGVYAKQLKNITDPFYLAEKADDMKQKTEQFLAAASGVKRDDSDLSSEMRTALEQIRDLLTELNSRTRPNFFRIGYYTMNHPGEDVTKMDLEKLNEISLQYLDDNYMRAFIEAEEKGVKHAFQEALERKKALLPKLAEAETYFMGDYEKKDALKYAKDLADQVEESIDRLEIQKDTHAYTFRNAMHNGIERYFAAVKNNPKEENRFAKQSARREALIEKGKNVSWKVVPKTIYDLDELKANLVTIVTRLEAHYTARIAEAEQVDYRARSLAIIEFLREKASKVVYQVTPAMAKERAIKLMEEVGISQPRMRYYQYPFEFSGGMRQRIVIAIALAADPEILICDEPTTALDVTIQAQILELINNLKRERNLSVIFITHDLGVVANMADEIAVMYAGKIVEYGSADDIFYDPRHPYTWALLSSMPDLDTKEKLDAIPGTPPNMIYPPVGDAFADRNKYAMQIDYEEQPPMFRISDTHSAATWLLHPDAPKVDIPKVITDRIERMKKAGGEPNV